MSGTLSRSIATFFVALFVIFSAHPSFSEEADLAAGIRKYLDADFLGAAKILEPLAEKGVTEAQYILGDMLLHMRGGFVADMKKSWLRYYPKKKLRDNDRLANEPVTNWYTLGMAMLQAATSKGHAGARYSLGYYYLIHPTMQSAGPEHSIKLGFALLEKAARENLGPAAYRLGSFHFLFLAPAEVRTVLPVYWANLQNDLSHAERVRKAKEAFETAIALGSYPAAIFLGEMYENGQLGASNVGKALDLYLLAAGQGYTDAFDRLGHYYSNGLADRPMDHTAAYKWYLLVEKFARRPPHTELEKLRDQLSLFDRSAAEEAASSFLVKVENDPTTVLAKAMRFCHEYKKKFSLCRKIAVLSHDKCSYLYTEIPLDQEFSKSKIYAHCRRNQYPLRKSQ